MFVPVERAEDVSFSGHAQCSGVVKVCDTPLQKISRKCCYEEFVLPKLQ